jgi:hypothetical protein
MKNPLVLILLVALHADAFACGSAEQSRIFPVGIVQAGLVVVEMEMGRGEGNDERLHWSGTSYLVVYDFAHQVKSRQQLQDFRFADSDYSKGISAAFRFGLERARKMEGIALLAPKSILFADYARSCSALSLHNDTLKKELSLVVSKKHYPVTVARDTNSIARVWFHRYMTESYYGSVDYSDYYDHLGISSIRKFQAGKRELLIVHLGDGQTMHTADGEPIPAGKEYKAGFSFDKLENSAFEEPVMHHGAGFDFFVFL